MPSFIKYQISRANWIKIDDEKVAPNACCLQERLNLELLLHTPKINYKKFKEEFNISQNEIKKILVEVGVAEHFTDLSFAKQYEIAKQLHTLEKGSEIAPKIYSLMASNDEKVSDKIREDFKKFGRVLVKANNEKHFVPVLQAFWADKRKFGANILRDFNIFDISGVGAKKVEAVFGVNSLNLEVKLEEFGRVSEDMQREFEKKFNDLKPYLLFERYHNKGFEKDIELFKSVKIMLVYSLELSYFYQKQKRCNVLDEYEFFKQDKCIYIKIPAQIANIKFGDIKFATTLSEAVCEILEVSERNYRELIKANKEERKECIKADNDKSEDEIEEILQEIRKELDFENKRVEFWKIIAKMKQVSYENEKTTLEMLKISEALAGEVDYENINESQNINPLSEIFTALDIRLADFNRLFDEEIDFSRHWQREFKQLKQKYENGYLYFLFEKFKDSSSVSKFEESRLYYQKFEIEGRGKIKFDLNEIFENKFGVALENLERFRTQSIKNVIEANRAKYDATELLELEYKFGKERVESCLLFGVLDELLPKKKAKSTPQSQTHTATQTRQNHEFSQANTTQNTAVKTLNSARNSTATRASQMFDEDGGEVSFYDNVEIKKPEISIPKASQETRNKPKVTHQASDEWLKQETGECGEKAVFDELSKKRQVNWLSGNAQKCGFVTQGDDSLGYDMSYVDESGVEIFVEVKSSLKARIEFYMSKNEVDFALNNASVYEIYFVNFGKDGIEISQLGAIFDFKENESFFQNSKFTATADTYKITAQKAIEEV